MLVGLRALEPEPALLAAQWQLFLDLLETEGSMGFTRADPKLFDAFAHARLAILHLEELLRVVEVPLLQALRHARGGDEAAAARYWRGGRISRTGRGRIAVPFRVPASGPWRLRVGFLSWRPPGSFFVQPAPDQRWDRRSFSPAAGMTVDHLVRCGFDSQWMAAHLPLDEELVAARNIDDRIVDWAHARFVDLVESGIFALPVEALGDVTAPDAATDE
jgi:hypothetical protein